MRLVVLGVLEQHLVHVRAGVLVQLVGAAEDDERDLAVAQHRQLVRFLHHAELGQKILAQVMCRGDEPFIIVIFVREELPAEQMRAYWRELATKFNFELTDSIIVKFGFSC